MPTRILLVRHGESEWNAAGRWQGRADPPLSDLGRRQAVTAARAVGAVDGVFSSPLLRAFATATLIAEAVGVGAIVVDDDLVERDAGEWSGLTRCEIEEQWPGYLDPPPADEHTEFGAAGSERSMPRRRPPGWEGDDAVLERGLAAIDRIHARVDGGEVLAVTHGGLIYMLERHLGAPFGRLANLEGRWVTRDGDGLRLGDRACLIDPAVVPVTIPGQL